MDIRVVAGYVGTFAGDGLVVNLLERGALKPMLEVPYPQVHPDFYCPVDLKVGLRWGRMKKL